MMVIGEGGIQVEGPVGTWYVIDVNSYESGSLYLVEHEY